MAAADDADRVVLALAQRGGQHHVRRGPVRRSGTCRRSPSTPRRRTAPRRPPPRRRGRPLTHRWIVGALLVALEVGGGAGRLRAADVLERDVVARRAGVLLLADHRDGDRGPRRPPRRRPPSASQRGRGMPPAGAGGAAATSPGRARRRRAAAPRRPATAAPSPASSAPPASDSRPGIGASASCSAAHSGQVSRWRRTAAASSGSSAPST